MDIIGKLVAWTLKQIALVWSQKKNFVKNAIYFWPMVSPFKRSPGIPRHSNQLNIFTQSNQGKIKNLIIHCVR